MTNQGPRLVLA